MHASRKPAHAGARKPPRRPRHAPRTRSVIAATALLIVCGAPFATARTGDNLREGVRNGTTTSETEIIANIATTTADKGGYAMRMSNLSSTGGGFINGCRASAAATSKPCYRANNLSNGRAFEFNSNNGTVVGTITAGAAGARPFTTNATAVATGLNADRVDNLDAAQIIATARSKTGLAAETADNAANADKLDGLDSTQLSDPRAFARVEEDATVASALAKGIASDNVTRPSTGVYCFDLPFNPVSVQASVEGNSDPDEIIQVIDADSPDGLVNCPAGTEIEVSHYDTGSDALENGDFYIWLL